jgi:3-methyladenine DNA glycosylase AlkD
MVGHDSGLDRIAGRIALKFLEVNKILLAWSTDDNIWLRRIAIDHQLFRKDKTDTALLEAIIKNNLGQTEFFINKAIGWALREYGKTNPEWVKNFIEKYKKISRRFRYGKQASIYKSKAASTLYSDQLLNIVLKTIKTTIYSGF